MVVLTRIYTRGGDGGTTSLGTGERRKKQDLRIETYGTVDEANACIGLARIHTASEAAHAKLDAMLLCIQNDLFDLGADLCMPENTAANPKVEALRILPAQVERLERDIDTINAGLEPLSSFVLPGGTPAAAALHLARTVARRAERLLCALRETPGESVGAPTLAYLNRLSDFLFVAARHVNQQGAGDVLWVPGLNR
ncbi:cob(I)yrinic acid a,c-diamide adenosyltransferase [Beijerinckia indica]|uniref:Corrinoid adenosyltransferase n=1 Tax=Beijerinckia indica subsp. indica (strain ATCC 9039 / DSM 1715 / NCIMB 8712) TaxID=395963 RepID=B2IBT5_BEII9|nr:cob(I)yrinic acid a,c-diamide adenosyltransferase [Beijerinckia indica]ACB93807.1 ATP--cobalamin adenosyltransferase [Beijerinckia indica subsp. indica ATCC 9039]